MYKWVLLKQDNRILSCLIDAQTDRTLELHIDAANEDALRIGDICTGRIDRIMHGLHAAFIDLPGNTKGYLPTAELDHAFFTKRQSAGKSCQGDELLVQVKQEAMKSKAATVTAELSLTDSLLVMGAGRRRGEAGCGSGQEAPIGETGQESGTGQGRGRGQDRDEPEVRISKKVHATDRQALKTYGQDLLHVILSENTGDVGGDRAAPALSMEDDPVTGNSPSEDLRPWLLLRTEAATMLREGREAEIKWQAVRAYRTLQRIICRAPFLTFGTVHFRSPAPYLQRIARMRASEIAKIVTDDESLYRELMTLCYPDLVLPPEDEGFSDRWLRARQREWEKEKEKEEKQEKQEKEEEEDKDRKDRKNDCGRPEIELYRDSMVSLFHLQSMTRRLEEATDKTVFLKSGGSLVIEHTEALHVIDVNTGKSDGSRKKGADKEKEILKLNLEAAGEAARQIRLRNLSGIIVIDFINMRERAHETLLMEHLKGLLAKDPVEAKLIDMTKLGLVEITRKKIERPLWETMRA